MKWIYAILLFSFLPPESYVVVNVQGKAWVYRDHKADTLVRGNRVLSTDTVYFSNGQGLVRMASNAGTFYVRHNEQVKRKNVHGSTLWASIKSELLPTRKTGEMMSRGTGINNLVDATTFFRQFHHDSMAFLVIDQRRVEVSYDLIDTLERVFFFSWKNNGTDINKVIPWYREQGRLYMNFDHRLFQVDGQPIDQPFLHGELGLYDKVQHSVEEIATLAIRRIDGNELKAELCEVVKGLYSEENKLSFTKEKRQQLYEYMLSWYGLPDKDHFTGPFLDQLNCQQ